MSTQTATTSESGTSVISSVNIGELRVTVGNRKGIRNYFKQIETRGGYISYQSTSDLSSTTYQNIEITGPEELLATIVEELSNSLK